MNLVNSLAESFYDVFYTKEGQATRLGDHQTYRSPKPIRYRISLRKCEWIVGKR